MGTSAEYRVTLGVNLRRYWSAENQVMLGRMLFDEDVPALRAELAASEQNLKTMLQAAGEEAERQLAEKEREIEKWVNREAAACPEDFSFEESLASERAAREKAEQRVRVLEAVIVREKEAGELGHGHDPHPPCRCFLCIEAQHILAARKGESHG